jgi:hypothetical protein
MDRSLLSESRLLIAQRTSDKYSLNVEFLPIIAIASAYPENLLLFC